MFQSTEALTPPVVRSGILPCSDRAGLTAARHALNGSRDERYPDKTARHARAPGAARCCWRAQFSTLAAALRNHTLLPHAHIADGASPSADDLRQALRDHRRVAEMYEEGSSNHLDHLRIAQTIEAQLRARIAADLAAMKLAQVTRK